MIRPSLISDRRNPLRLQRSAPAPADDRHERDGDASRRLWSACVLQCLADARHKDHRDEIRRWLDTADFRGVCDLANADPERVRRAIEAELLLPVRERNEYNTRKLGYVRKRKASAQARALAFEAADDGR